MLHRNSRARRMSHLGHDRKSLTYLDYVRFAPQSCRRPRSLAGSEMGPLTELAAVPQSTMVSARARTSGGTAIPRSLATLKLTVRRDFSDPLTGRSAGFAPLRISPM